MNQRQRGHLVLAANAALAAGIALTLAWAIWPGELPDPSHGQMLGRAAGQAAHEESETFCGDYSAIYQADLRAPLFDAPPVQMPPASAPAVVVPVRLLGTIVEEGFSYAMLRGAGGESRTASIGETVDGVEILSIAASSATVRYSGQTMTLKVEAEEPKR